MSIQQLVERVERWRREPALPTGKKLVLSPDPGLSRSEVLRLEIEREFRGLQGHPYDALIDSLWLRLQRRAMRDRQRRSTSWGRRLARECDRRRAAKLRTTIVGTGTCQWCGKPFLIDAWRVKFGKTKACAPGCALKQQNSGALYTVGDRTMSAPQWAAEVGIPYLRLHRRLKRGLSIEVALTKERFPTRPIKRPGFKNEVEKGGSGG